MLTLRGPRPSNHLYSKVRLAGLEPTASASAGLRSIQLSYKRSKNPNRLVILVSLVPKEGFEPTHP